MMFEYNRVFLPPKHEHRLLGLVLVTLYFAQWWDFSSIVSRLLLSVHFGLFLLWQPLWGRQEAINVKKLLFFLTLLTTFIISFNPWLITLWQIVLIGLMGGRDFVKPRDRLVNIAAIIFLVLNLFVINIPQLFVIEELAVLSQLPLDSQLLIRYSLLVLPISFLFVSTENSLIHRSYIDFFHALTLSLLIIIIALGSLVLMYHSHYDYPFAVFQMSLSVAVFILITSWLWVLFSNHHDIDQVWTQHLLNVGGAFEQWLDNLARPEHYKSLSPQNFLLSGLEHLVTLPWVSGVAWNSIYGEDCLGNTDEKHHVVLKAQSLEVTIYAYHRINSSHYFYVKLLVQLLEHFHQAKRREEAFAQQMHLQAIYETGAKLTHDIKNLLQSLHAISSAIETCQPSQFGDTQRLLQGQMPHLTQRLKRTLDKLQKPTKSSYMNIPVTLWWDNLQARYVKQNIEFNSNGQLDNFLIPEDLFDNVLENLLQNALMKRKREVGLEIDVSLFINNGRLSLTVADNGSPIPEDIASTLLSHPVVSSQDGFGIGLYQAAKQISHAGFKLLVSENVAGQVCFELINEED